MHNNHWSQQQLNAIQYAALQMQQQQLMALQMMQPMPLHPMGQQHSDDDVSDEEDEDDEQKRTLFCANLDERVTEELLFELFLQAGPIESVRIPKDNVGRPRSFGFVTYVHRCSAPYAMQLYQGLALFRKSLTVKYQGSTASTTSTPQRRSLPNDCEVYQQRRSGGNSGGRSSYDNSSMRSSNYAAANSDHNSSTESNPFRGKHTSSATASTRNARQNAAPYQRHSGGGNDNQRKQSHSGGSDSQHKHPHSGGSNRRAEQRHRR